MTSRESHRNRFRTEVKDCQANRTTGESEIKKTSFPGLTLSWVMQSSRRDPELKRSVRSLGFRQSVEMEMLCVSHKTVHLLVRVK